MSQSLPPFQYSFNQLMSTLMTCVLKKCKQNSNPNLLLNSTMNLNKQIILGFSRRLTADKVVTTQVRYVRDSVRKRWDERRESRLLRTKRILMANLNDPKYGSVERSQLKSSLSRKQLLNLVRIQKFDEKY